MYWFLQSNTRAAQFLEHKPNVRQNYLKALQLLEANPSNPSFRLHALQDKHEGLHPVSTSLSYRITQDFVDSGLTNHPGKSG